MIYLDNSATTAALPMVAEAVSNTLLMDYGNPSSPHGKGVVAERLLTQARARVATLLQCEATAVHFTSGGTEANNWAIFGLLAAHHKKRGVVLMSDIEHPSVLETSRDLERMGYTVTCIPVDERGIVTPDALQSVMSVDVLLCCVMHVNNETGVVQDIPPLVRVLKERAPEARFHCDGVQAAGHVPVSFATLEADTYAVSGHKIHAPKGVGALVVRRQVRIARRQFGGDQENALRAGTENMPGIVGFGVAAEQFAQHQLEWQEHMRKLRDRLADRLGQLPDVVIHTPPEARDNAPHILSVSFPVGGEILLHALEEAKIYIGTGSACSTRRNKISPVLLAMGLPRKVANGGVRFSLSPLTQPHEIESVATVIKVLLPTLVRYR